MGLFPGKTREQLNASWADDMLSDYPLRSIEEKRKRNTENVLGLDYDDQTEVTIVQVQWWERETYWIVADRATNKKAELSDTQYRTFEVRMKTLGMDVQAARMQRKVFKQAFLGGEILIPAGPSPIKGEFSWKCITGELNKTEGTWFGLVKVLRDPQMWANKWLSQILHILNTTAKGGIIAELDAFDDQREAEDKYAHPDTITWAANGAISGQNPKIIPKPGAGNISGYVDLLQMAIAAPYQVTGINLELLGQQDQQQPGIVEMMRKQAGMTVLATLFDSLRRFRKMIGRGRLYYIQNFLSDGRLIRIVGPDYVQAVPLAKEKTVGEYDVVVDDTPTSPNQKEANWAIIQPLLAVFKDQLMANPKVFAMLLEYSPLPSRIVEGIKAFIDQAANDPQAQQDKELTKKLSIQDAVATISQKQSVAELNLKKAGATEATAMYDIAMARNLLAKNDIDGLANHLKAMEMAQTAQKTAADVDHTKAKTARELVGIATDKAKAHNDTLDTISNARASTMGSLIDHLSASNDRVAALGGLHRDMAAARKDHAAAALTQRTPAPQEGETPPPEPPPVMLPSPRGAIPIPHRIIRGAKQAPDGHYYISDPTRPGKFARVVH